MCPTSACSTLAPDRGASLARLLAPCALPRCMLSTSRSLLSTSNARNLGVKVAFHHVDILNAVPQPQQFHIIVSNPPYICKHEQQLMEDNVLRYEPHSALFVPDNDPLLFYRAIARYASVALKPGGKLYFEINAAYGNATAKLLSEFHFADIEVVRDFYGRDRFVSALWLP